MTQSHVEVSYSGAVATLTLNRPPHNVMHIEMMEEMNADLLEVRSHAEVKVLVIRGAGDVFCGGLDFSEHTRDKVSRLIQVFHRIYETIRLLDVIAVAAVHGKAHGGGFQLAIGCNLVVAAKSATFALPEVDIGVFPPLACVILPRAAPRRKAMEWILTGEAIPAEELAAFGLVNRVWPDKQFEKGLEEFVARLTRKSGPVLRIAKRAQTESYYAGYEEALYKAENLYLRELMALDDPQEGIHAYLEQREPQWKNA